ncbi:hypothetical protein AURDEDRAFT_178381 [Auricularia subglabra TFB-10046 SS5]|uniref:Uncharacterized protein n=1 Tax=Auricularia subglabra (strain TFB-10046 / SS5) TaxID=717982 RepID=J0WL98_AURST|nr:hypothetical protein AURDEDRAFT_178381 [Auricularia subglabra TFB-10046 SS5]
MTFSQKHPVYLQPLLEPRFLPLAVANSFRVDLKHRDFIFLKIVDKPSVNARPVHKRSQVFLKVHSVLGIVVAHPSVSAIVQYTVGTRVKSVGD